MSNEHVIKPEDTTMPVMFDLNAWTRILPFTDLAYVQFGAKASKVRCRIFGAHLYRGGEIKYDLELTIGVINDAIGDVLAIETTRIYNVNGAYIEVFSDIHDLKAALEGSAS